MPTTIPTPSPNLQHQTLVYDRYRAAGVQARWSLDNPGNRAILDERTHAIGRLIRMAGWRNLSGRHILDVGCGSGRELARMTRFGAHSRDLHGVDLLAERVREARRWYPHLRFDVADAERLEGIASGSVDLVLTMTLFSSITEDAAAQRVAHAVTRVLKPGGAVLWYDMRVSNPRNPNVRGWSRRRIAELFPGFNRYLERITLVPPIARRLGRYARLLYPWFAAVPWLRTHYLGWFTKPEGRAHG